MDYFLIVVLGVVVFALWRSGENAAERQRDEIGALGRELEALRAQVAALQKSAGPPPAAAQHIDSPQASQQPGAHAAEPGTPAIAQQTSTVAPPAPAETSRAPLPKPWTEVPPPPKPLTQNPTAQAPVFKVEESAEPAAASAASVRTFSLEERLGANWLNKLGIAILVIGLAFFLAVKLQSWGPAGKVFCGYAVSAALLAGGVWLERKPTYRVFARAGIGGGWALGFFTTYAMHHVTAARVVDSLVVDLALMLAMAGGMVAHSLRYRSQTVTGLAFLLAFTTLLTSDLEAENGTVVFSLTASAILALALVVVTTLRHWAMLELAGLAAVYLNHFLWLTQVMPADHRAFAEFWPSTILVLLYWAIFRIAYVMRTPLDQREENVSSLSAIVNSAGVLGLLKYQSAHPEWAFWALAALGAVEMALAFWARPRRRQAFVVLSTIATVLLVAAVPFRFHGVSWPVLWLVEAHVLALCGLRMGEPVFRRLGLLAGLITGGVLAVHDVLPLIVSRIDAADATRHVSLTVALGLAAILYWVHAEVYPRRWPEIAGDGFEALALRVTSWLGLGAAATCVWVVLPPAWVVVGWLALVLLLGLVADGINSVALALQADALAVSALVGMFLWNSDLFETHTSWWGARAPRFVAVALLYAGMRRKTMPVEWPRYVAPVYSWVASLILTLLVADLMTDVRPTPGMLVLVWIALGLSIFEIGRFASKAYLRWQGFFVAGIAFVFFFAVDLLNANAGYLRLTWDGPLMPVFSVTKSILLEVMTLSAAGYWLMERTRSEEHCTRSEHIVGIAADALGTVAIAVWFALRFPSFYVPVRDGAAWVTAIWAGMATVLLTLAWVMRRKAFLVQAVVLAVAVAVRGLLMDLFADAPAGFWHGPLLHLSVSALILTAGLPFAFKARDAARFANSRIRLPEDLDLYFRRPEQVFFFSPFVLVVVALAVKLSSGHITIAWSLLGVAVFLFALAVGERSYRLAGLGLLLVSVVKILLMDVWALSPSDRYTTLIVLGLALLAVSFLYTRFGTVIRKYL